MNVLIYSRDDIEEIILKNEFPANTAVISFYDKSTQIYDDDFTPVDYSKVCKNVYYCELDDLDIECLEEEGYTYATYFEDADKVAEFIYQAYKNDMNIICQCEYGQSRSAGCAAAILQYFYKTGIDIFTDYSKFPSRLVYHKIFDSLKKHCG